MPHQEFKLNGKKLDSVTEILSYAGDKTGLMLWAGKHGVLKAQALYDYVINPNCSPEYEPIIDNIPDGWFEKNNINKAEFWNSPKQLGEIAAERGRSFHEDVANYAVGKMSEVKDKEAIATIDKWVKTVGFTPRNVEKHVISEAHQYHGTYDCDGYFFSTDTIEIVDWKRANYISDTYTLQLAAYAKAYSENSLDAINKGRIVRLYELDTEAKKDSIKDLKYSKKYSFAGSKFYIEERQFSNLEQFFELFICAKKLHDFFKTRGA